MHFNIDKAYLTSITIKKEWGMYDHKESLTEDELVKVLQGKDRCSTVSSVDHPEFSALRETLGKEGFIFIERGWWNGDEVIKPFTLNGKRFKKGDQFPCAAALNHVIK